MTRKFTKNLIHDIPFSLPWPCADYSIAMNTTNYTEMQQFSAVTDCESKIRIFKVFFSKYSNKYLKFGLFLKVLQVTTLFDSPGLWW